MPHDYTYLDKIDRTKTVIRSKHCTECGRLYPMYCYKNPTDKICENCIQKKQKDQKNEK